MVQKVIKVQKVELYKNRKQSPWLVLDSNHVFDSHDFNRSRELLIFMRI